MRYRNTSVSSKLRHRLHGWAPFFSSVNISVDRLGIFHRDPVFSGVEFLSYDFTHIHKETRLLGIRVDSNSVLTHEDRSAILEVVAGSE